MIGSISIRGEGPDPVYSYGPGLVRNRDVAKRRGLEPKVNVIKICINLIVGVR